MTMLSFGLLCILATLTHGITVGNSSDIKNEHEARERFTTIANVILTYKQYVPSELVEELEEMMQKENAGEIDEFIKFANYLRNVDLITSEMDVIGRRLKKDSPKLYTRFARLFTSTLLKMLNISEPAQEFMTELTFTESPRSMPDNVRFLAGVKKSFDALPLAYQLEYEVQFPEIMKFFKS